ncbi:DUF6226 family protein [Microbacterium sp. QXD-8]|uniref:DUF6226 family protein n=1 Tax=Microbacterium psychrotolerans TaxID=3068321 RepID=A0ABU0YXK5_9MICO|nr:DUF6226 family protein [Microbacterium sp. QXD-8]MDQ7877059.1 DUF6226 family protein [Microbacterium sp. QXD-8]
MLHDVADALIAWLAETYDVSVEETPEAVADLLRAPTDAVRVVRVRPADADASPLTFVFTSFPGIPLQAGLLFDSSYPTCGCDACDETGESCGSSLEEAVFAVADGGLSEARTPGVELSLSFRLDSARGSTGGSCREADYPVERQAAARDQLTPHRVWAPWPPRS